MLKDTVMKTVSETKTRLNKCEQVGECMHFTTKSSKYHVNLKVHDAEKLIV